MSKDDESAGGGNAGSSEQFEGVHDAELFKRFRGIPEKMDRRRKQLEELADQRTDLVAELIRRGWSQADIARHTDLTRMSISRIARGVRSSGG